MANDPEFVGRHRIERRLGLGRLGVLFLATDPTLERVVAVRIVPPFAGLRERVERTLRSLARLKYPGLAPIFDYGDHEGHLFFTREYVKGQALAKIISLKAPIPPANRLELLVTVCEVLAYAHRGGVAGLPVEPADLIVGPQGEAHIVDLGLAPLVEGAGADRDPSYLSPEAIAGRSLDPRSDIFAAGVLLYELFTYERPFGRGSAEEIRKRIAYGARWIPHDDLDPAVAAIVARALQFEITARYQSVEELLADLRILRTKQVDSPPVTVIVPDSPRSIPRSVEAREIGRQEISRLRSGQLERYLADARAALDQQDYDKAIEHAKHAALLDPANLQALELIERAHDALRAREREQARNASRAHDIARSLEQARESLARGSLAAADRLLSEVPALDPDMQEARTILEGARRERARLVDVARTEAARKCEEEARTRAGDVPQRQAGQIPAPIDVETTRRVDDNVRFAVYRPPAMAPQRWYSLLIFAHLGERRPDAPPDEPNPIDQVESTARTLLGPAASTFQRIIQDAGAGIPHEAMLKIVPSVPGLTFNPPELSFCWTESVHKADFRILASASLQGRTARGSIDVWMGAISVALITIAIPIDASAVDDKLPVPDVFQPYRRIFASYSHKDTAIVRQFENYARGIGDSYMRDVIDLRAGENWNDRLFEMIEAADVFQLFWSTNSMGSPFVRREWEHALTVDKSNFVRPLYWQSPFPERDGLPPPDLKARHFASVAVAAVSTADELERRLEEEVERDRSEREMAMRVQAAREQQVLEEGWAREAEMRRPVDRDEAMITQPKVHRVELPLPDELLQTSSRSAPPPRSFPMALIIGLVAIFLSLLGFLFTRC